MASVRSGKATKYLLRLGHDVRVVTAAPQGCPPTLDLEVPHSIVTYSKWIGTSGNKTPAPSGDQDARPGGGAPSKQRRPALLIPDPMLGWFPFALGRALAIANAWKPNIILASGGPFTGLLVGAAASRITGLPWIAELRDPWTGGPYSSPGPIRRRIERWLEDVTLSSASGIVPVTDAIGRDLKRFDKPLKVIYNGFDSEDMPDAGNAVPVSDGFLSIVHTGTLYRGARAPKLLFEALRGSSYLRSSVRVHFYGPDVRWLNLAVLDSGLADVVVLHPQVSHRESLRAQASADVLLFSQGPTEVMTVAGKLFEYMGSGRPILAMGAPRGEAAELIRKNNCGVVVTDAQEVVAQIETWLDTKSKLGYISALQDDSRMFFTRCNQTERLAAFLSELLGTQT
jgi:glycosyltransferase involved in cell wall biosynthesis